MPPLRIQTRCSRNCLLADQTELAQLREWGTNSRSYPRDRSVTEIFEEVARKFEEKTAVVAGEHRISYAALNSRANAVAAALRRAGVSEGDRVPLLLPRGVQFIACALGVMKCGAVYVPLDRSYPAEQLRRRLEATSPHWFEGSGTVDRQRHDQLAGCRYVGQIVDGVGVSARSTPQIRPT